MKQYQVKTVERNGRTIRAYDLPFQNVYETLEATAERLPDKVGLIDEKRSLTFAQLKAEVDQLAAYLHVKGHVRPGDRVGLMMLNSAAFCVTFYALMKLGATCVMHNTKLTDAELLRQMKDSGVTCLFADSRWCEKLKSVYQQTGIRIIISYGDDTPVGFLPYQMCMEEPLDPAAVPDIHDDTLPAVIMYTSGTTGRPKGAVMSHFNLLQGMYAYIAQGIEEDESTVLAVPGFHITGLNCIMTVFVMLGGLQVMLPMFDAEKTLDLMSQYQVTHFHAVATVYIMLCNAWKPHHDLSSLRHALCGGGFITRENIRKFCDIAPNVAFHPVYGMTETAGAGTHFPEHCLDSDIEDSAGVCAANCEMKTEPETGEICFRGAFIIERYLHDEQNDNIRDGWLHSGDVGRFDENGYLFIQDRLKDMINRGGEKVFSYEVESAIMEFGGIRQAAVFAVPHELYGEVPAAAYLTQGDVEIDEEALRAFLRKRLAHYKVPVYMRRYESLPLTPSNKVCKNVIRDEFRQKYLPEMVKG